MSRNERIAEWKWKLKGLNITNMVLIVGKLVDNDCTVGALWDCLNTHGPGGLQALLQKFGINSNIDQSEIIERVALTVRLVPCGASISVTDIEMVLRNRYFHPQDRKLLQATVTCLVKEIPSEVLSDAEIICESDTMFMAFTCGFKANTYRVVRTDGQNKFKIERGKGNNMSPVTGGLLGGGIGMLAGGAVGFLVAGPLGLAMGVMKTGIVCGVIGGGAGVCLGATATQNTRVAKICIGVGTGVIAGAVAGGLVAGPLGVACGAFKGAEVAVAGAYVGMATGAVVGAGAGIILGNTGDWKMIQDN